MKTYTIFDSDSIKGNISGTEETLQLNLKEGESWVEGYFTEESFYVDDGVIAPLPEKPRYPCFFDKAAKSWVWDEAESWSIFRNDRDRRLSRSDWTQVPDAPVDRQAWAVYRQQLRDLPDNTEDPRNTVWPVKPD